MFLRQSSIVSGKKDANVAEFNTNVTINCLQSIEALKMACDRLGLKFVDCSKREKCIKVDLILNSRRRNNRVYYLIKWKGYESKYNTWEPRKNLIDCDDLIWYFKALNNPPAYLNDKLMLYFIRDLVSRKPHDILTLTRLCALIYGTTEEYITSLALSFSELRNKALKVLDIPIRKLNKIRDKLLELMHFSEARKLVLSNMKEWEVKINTFNFPYVQVENNVDLEEPPKDFLFISDYLSFDIDISEKPVVFCSCRNCYDNRDLCCSHDLDGHFAYSKYRRLVLLPGHPIYECNKLCMCDQNCINRVVQHGQKTKVAIFKTFNGCGWGLKTMETIQKDQFVMEYLGEVITSEEAESRGELYVASDHSYLFDLDCGENLYTVDGRQVGNAAHFMNHSCDPNLHVFTVWINQHDPNLPRLAFFAKRKIKCGEELTFDYKMVDTRTKQGIPIPEDERVLCKCNARNCKKYLF